MGGMVVEGMNLTVLQLLANGSFTIAEMAETLDWSRRDVRVRVSKLLSKGAAVRSKIGVISITKEGRDYIDGICLPFEYDYDAIVRCAKESQPISVFDLARTINLPKRQGVQP